MSTRVDVHIDPAAARSLLYTPEARDAMAGVGRTVRDRARAGARVVSQKVDSIVSEPGIDAQGAYVDIGYAKHHPGFFLWWWEVGTRNHAPRPHLRPALRPL